MKRAFASISRARVFAYASRNFRRRWVVRAGPVPWRRHWSRCEQQRLTFVQCWRGLSRGHEVVRAEFPENGSSLVIGPVAEQLCRRRAERENLGHGRSPGGE